MLDIKFVRENPELVKENIKKKFQDKKLVLVDEVIELDKRNREIKQEVEALRANRNKISKEIGKLMGMAKKDPSKREEADRIREEVAKDGARIDELSAEEKTVEEELLKRMMVIPNIIDPSIRLFRSVRTIRRTLSASASVSRSFRISRSPTTRTSWRPSTASTSRPPAALRATVSII